MKDADIAREIARLAEDRGPGRTFCPSEVARALAADWRPLMPEVRRVAAGMEEIVVTQGGVPVDPEGAQGPVRLGKAC